jgi:hypothetical protein
LKFETRVGKSTRDQIMIHGYDLTEDLIGQITLADMDFNYRVIKSFAVAARAVGLVAIS